MTQVKYSIIIPTHKLSENKDLLIKAIESIKTTEPIEVLIISDGEFDLTDVIGLNKDIRVIMSDKDSSFATKFNLGASEAKGDFLVLLESDDQLTPNYLRVLSDYIEHYQRDIYLPINLLVNTKGESICYQNEILWSHGFVSDELGYLDYKTSNEFNIFGLGGFAVDRLTFNRFGGFKESMKYLFDYEFLNRFSFHGVEIMSIPMIGNKHLVGLEDSYSSRMNNITSEEYNFWLETAKSEAESITDRQVEYVKTK